MIIPTFKDLVTGDIRKADDSPDELYSVYWWTEGNGSCDCNRASYFDKDEEMDAAMRKNHPELQEHQSYCYGCKRFIAIDVEGDFEGMTKDELLAAMNSGYPKHATRCSNQNPIYPFGMYVGANECGCTLEVASE